MLPTRFKRLPRLLHPHRAGWEPRDVESLREHYTLTLRHWGRRLEARHAEATRLVGEGTVRVRRLYMAAAARAFATGGVGVVQALLSKPDAAGVAGLPLTRADLYTSAPGRSAPQPPQAQSRPRPEPRPERRMSYTR